MRGEDIISELEGLFYGGSPPHARGRLDTLGDTPCNGRITPACAGKTCPRPGQAPSTTDHPRMRGEDNLRQCGYTPHLGSPPHARGRRGKQFVQNRSVGITPACAGKTSQRFFISPMLTDHPRMRGEDSPNSFFVRQRRGSPPHARGRRSASRTLTAIPRITPACAGKTLGRSASLQVRWDHPRMRGEDYGQFCYADTDSGSPPHARGRPVPRKLRLLRGGITPACAGKTERLA